MFSYVALFFSLIKINLIKEMSYRANFFLNLIDSIVWFGITLVFFTTIYQYVTQIEGWDIYDIYILIGTSELIKSIVFVLFINNLPSIPNMVNSGRLDFVLLKPVSSQFLVSIRNLDMGNVGNIPFSIFIIIYAVMHKHIDVTFASTLIYVILIFISIILTYSLWFTTMTLSIWMSKIQGMHEMFLGALTLTRYPSILYKGIARVIFLFVFPILLVSNVPTEYFLHNNSLNMILKLLAYTIFYFILSILFWKYALKYYQSASS